MESHRRADDMTTENKHTPGPWKAEYEEYGEEIWFGGCNCGTWYVGPCYLGGDGDDPELKSIMDANASLIAAAPDLFEASPRAAEMLRVVSAFLRDQQPDGVARYDEADCDFCCIADDCDSSAEDIEAAIAKARGQ